MLRATIVIEWASSNPATNEDYDALATCLNAAAENLADIVDFDDEGTFSFNVNPDPEDPEYVQYGHWKIEVIDG